MKYLNVPVGDGIGDAKSTSEASGMLTFKGANDLDSLAAWLTLSSTKDWNTSLMFVLGNRNMHL